MRASMLAGLSGLCIVASATQSDRAEFTFHNDTGDRVVFNLQCLNGSDETLSIGPNRSRTYRCVNGAHAARLEVYTDDDSAEDKDGVDEFLVRDQVYDAETYTFYRDAVGYVEVVRFR